MKLWKFPKIEGSILNYKAPPLWPIYTGEKRTTFAKAYRIKVRYYWELFGEHVKNLGTLCFGTPSEVQDNKEDPSLHDVTSHWLHRNRIPKNGCHYFLWD
jgi:hypothetical protein